jgi:hypothetical protein
MTTNSTNAGRTSLRERHQRDLEAALATLKNELATISEGAIHELQGCLERYRADGTARNDRMLATLLAIVQTVGWLGMLAGIGGVLASVWGMLTSRATGADVGISLFVALAMGGICASGDKWMASVSRARWAASSLKEHLKPLNRHLLAKAGELTTRNEAAREFHAAVEEKGQPMRYFHFQALHAMTQTPTIEQDVDEMFEGPFATAQTFVSIGLMLALATALARYVLIGGGH